MGHVPSRPPLGPQRPPDAPSGPRVRELDDGDLNLRESSVMLVGFGVLLGILSSWWFLAAAFAVLAVKGLIEGHELEHPPTWERHGRVMVRTPASRPPNVRPPSSPTGLQRAAKLWTKREIETIGAELDGEP